MTEAQAEGFEDRFWDVLNAMNREELVNLISTAKDLVDDIDQTPK